MVAEYGPQTQILKQYNNNDANKRKDNVITRKLLSFQAFHCLAVISQNKNTISHANVGSLC